MEDFHHISVMPDEVLRALAPHPGGIYVDGTLGGAGHSGLILSASEPDGILIGFDRDEEALATATGGWRASAGGRGSFTGTFRASPRP
jgi:16S rRNA (cytosine1402-N4)-methyltransferase